MSWTNLLSPAEEPHTHSHRVAYKACEALISVIHWGGLRGRETVHWLWQTEEFIAGSAIHTWLRSLAVCAASLWHLYDTLSTWCRLQLKRSVFSMRTGWVCMSVCVCPLTVCFFWRRLPIRVCHCASVWLCWDVCVRVCMSLHENVCALWDSHHRVSYWRNKLSVTHF